MVEGFYRDPTMIAFGEENRDWGGAFGVYRGLTEALPYPRLFNSPISEGAIVGAGVGYALSGGRVVAELMYCDSWAVPATRSSTRWRSGRPCPAMCWRCPGAACFGRCQVRRPAFPGFGSAMIAHVPGPKAYFPATAYDAKGMLALALRGSDPVVFFESQRLYPEPETLVEGGVRFEDYVVPEGEPALRRSGSDLTIPDGGGDPLSSTGSCQSVGEPVRGFDGSARHTLYQPAQLWPAGGVPCARPGGSCWSQMPANGVRFCTQWPPI
jgi:2-oxoisovalerate dehydrogenase E1 component